MTACRWSHTRVLRYINIAAGSEFQIIYEQIGSPARGAIGWLKNSSAAIIVDLNRPDRCIHPQEAAASRCVHDSERACKRPN